MIGKRGEEGIGTLVAIISVAVAAIILFAFSGELFAKGKNASDIEACRLSVIAQGETKIAGKTLAALKCPRREIKLFDGKTELNGKKLSYKFKDLNEEIVNKAVAEELRLCWYRMGEGKKNIFNEPFFAAKNPDEFSCVVCSEIEFDLDLKTRGFSGITGYLKKTKIEKSSQTYWDYIVKPQQVITSVLGVYVPKQGDTSKIEEINFEAGRRYTIYYAGYNIPWLAEFRAKFPSVDKYSDSFYIGLASNEKVAKECVELYN